MNTPHGPHGRKLEDRRYYETYAHEGSPSKYNKGKKKTRKSSSRSILCPELKDDYDYDGDYYFYDAESWGKGKGKGYEKKRRKKSHRGSMVMRLR